MEAEEEAKKFAKHTKEPGCLSASSTSTIKKESKRINQSHDELQKQDLYLLPQRGVNPYRRTSKLYKYQPSVQGGL